MNKATAVLLLFACALAAASGAANHCSKVSLDAKILGSRKLSSAHSSPSEFCRGVPVSRVRVWV